MNVKRMITERFYPEVRIAGFSHVDGTISMYSQIAALLKSSDHVLDFGAGRGEQIVDDPVPYRRWLQNLQGRCAHVEGCDVDEAVLSNPHIDGAKVIKLGERLPYEDSCFDMIISRYVFEHVDDPHWMAEELLRVLKPGGWICALTPNIFGYISLAARLIPNRLHIRALTRIQPHRKAEDVFPTRYKLNSIRALKRYFGKSAEVYVYRWSSEPAYHFNSKIIYSFFKFLHKVMPDNFHTTLFIFIQKRK